MANLTQDGNNTKILHVFCDKRLFGVNQEITISAINTVFAVTAFLGNALIIAALQKPSSLHPSSKLLFGSLATTDLCVGLISQPLRVFYLMSSEHSKRRCYYYLLVSNSTGFYFCAVSLFTLTAISVERLLALILGVRFKHVVTLGRVWIFVVILWLSTIAIAILIIYYASGRYYIISTIILLCVITFTFCYTKIYLELRHNQAQIQGHVDQRHRKEGRIPANLARYKKTVSSALWVQLTLVACYLPFGVIVAIFAITGSNTPGIDLGWEASAAVLMLNSSINPFIYFWKIREIRQALKDTIRQLCCFSC